jgi:hypothetical protein
MKQDLNEKQKIQAWINCYIAVASRNGYEKAETAIEFADKMLDALDERYLDGSFITLTDSNDVDFVSTPLKHVNHVNEDLIIDTIKKSS